MEITKIEATYTIINFLRNIRITLGKTGNDLSVKLGKAKSYISILEKGNIGNIKINDFRNLIKILLPQITVELTNENLVLIAKAINENHGHIENVLMDINNINILKLNRELLVSELEKQLTYKGLVNVVIDDTDYDKVDRECNLPKDTLYKIVTGERQGVTGEFGVNLKCELQPDFVYTSLKKVFTYLDLINPNKIDSYLNMLGVIVPNIANVEKIDKLTICYRIDKDLGNMGDYLDKWYSELLKGENDNYISAVEYRESVSSDKNNYVDNRKQELHNKINQVTEILHSIVNKIDSDDYTGTIQYEAIVQTITELLLTKGGLRVVQDLFLHPLHKLNESDIKSVCDVVNDKLDFQYVVVEEDKTETSEQMTLFDLLYQHTHLECVSKKSISDTESTIIPLVDSDNNKKQD